MNVHILRGCILRAVLIIGLMAFASLGWSGQSILAEKWLGEKLLGDTSLDETLIGEMLVLDKAVTLALERDAVVEKLARNREQLLEEAQASNQLPDPVLKFGLRNLPTDTLSLDQEPMTQTVVAINQMFPPGDVLEIKKDIQLNNADQISKTSEERRLFVVKNVRLLWYEIYFWNKTIDILVEDQVLFEQILSITQSLFTVGRKKQHDVLRAEVEISRLKERIIVAKSGDEKSRNNLSQWIGAVAYRELPDNLVTLPRLPNYSSVDALTEQLRAHPSLVKQDLKVAQGHHLVNLAKQNYKPIWGVDVTYAYRDGDNLNGSNRSDFFSAMASVQLPLFSKQKQDKALSARKYAQQSERSAYLDLLRVQVATIQMQYSVLNELESRLALYQEFILTQSKQQADTTLSAYESDTTDFSELIQAYLSDQKVQLDYQRLLVDRQKVLSELHFLLGDRGGAH